MDYENKDLNLDEEIDDIDEYDDVEDFDVEHIYTFDDFKEDYPGYLGKLNNHIRVFYNTYILVYNKKRIKLSKKEECLDTAKRCGYGMLLRHMLETISTSIATENGIEVCGRSVFERFQALKGQNISSFTPEIQKALEKLLNITNDIAHPHVIGDKTISYDDLKSFYENSFKSVLESHIAFMQSTLKSSKKHDFDVPKEILKNRKFALNYLVTLKKEAENFNVFNKTTHILTLGCLVRQLTESTANLWCYNNKVVPTDASTFENQINLSKVLSVLSTISRSARKGAFGTTALTPDVVSNLYELKDASNALMHVEKFGSGDLENQGKVLDSLYKSVKSECSPHIMKKKLAETESLRKKIIIPPKPRSPVLTVLLCGILGHLGAHHFYTKSYAKGFVYFFTFGFIIGPALDLWKIVKGKFRNSRRALLKRTLISRLLAFILLLCHISVIFSVLSKIDYDKVIERVKNFDPYDIITLKEHDSSLLMAENRISVLEASASSVLEGNDAKYGAGRCIDANLSTCWQEGVEGNGQGESLTFVFPENTEISQISILNGQFLSEKEYFGNTRASFITLDAGSKKYYIKLKDIMERQTFSFSSPVKTGNIRITFNSVYPGSQWFDLCITEIEFYKQGEAND